MYTGTFLFLHSFSSSSLILSAPPAMQPVPAHSRMDVHCSLLRRAFFALDWYTWKDSLVNFLLCMVLGMS